MILLIIISLKTNIIALLLKRKKKKVKREIDNSLFISNEINNILDLINARLNSDRSWVFQFHNGSAFINGLPYMRVTNTYERCKLGIVPQIKKLQNLPIGAAAFFTRRLFVDKENITLFDINDLIKNNEKDYTSYQILKNQCIKSIYAVSLITLDEAPLGFIGVDYVKEKCLLDQKNIEFLEEAADRICAFLASKRNDK
ncbi:hypothetical protein GMMP15_840027 [Candidatus Magnetomoraceae bacterium gMMP-15]